MRHALKISRVMFGLGFGLSGALGGCSGESLTSSLAKGPGGQGSGLTNTALTKKPAFSPFQDRTSGPVSPRRQVIKNPTRGQIMKSGPLPEITLGRADAPITLIKYASLTCPFCRRFQKEVFPILNREYIKTGKVRYILREFPIGHQSGLATVAWRCAGPKHAIKLYEAYLFNQRQWVSQQVRPAPILKIAKRVGLTSAQFNSCRKNQAMVDGLKWVKDRGRTLGIIGTPNFFINEKLIKRRLGIKELRAILDPMLAG